MNYSYIQDENGKIVDVLVNGKPVKRGSMRGFKKAQKCSYFRLIPDGQVLLSDGTQMTGLEATIFNFVKNWERRYSRFLIAGNFDDIKKFTETPVETFDDMRYFFMEINSSLYMELLD
jgi:hypothetical protein